MILQLHLLPLQAALPRAESRVPSWYSQNRISTTRTPSPAAAWRHERNFIKDAPSAVWKLRRARARMQKKIEQSVPYTLYFQLSAPAREIVGSPARGQQRNCLLFSTAKSDARRVELYLFTTSQSGRRWITRWVARPNMPIWITHLTFYVLFCLRSGSRSIPLARGSM